nr:ADM_HP1_G0035360.mRNA.1.CDS.1 [Saccharomyces cerevisiae]
MVNNIMHEYVPPSQRLFHSRHRITRNDLKEEALHSGTTDWTTILDTTIDKDTNLISYAVPIIDNFAIPRANSQGSPVAPSPNHRSTMYSSSSSSASSVFSDGLFNPNNNRNSSGSSSLVIRPQKNLSVDSLIQENKRKINSEKESLSLIANNNDETLCTHTDPSIQNLIKSETKRNILNLKFQNRNLFRRELKLEKFWSNLRSCHTSGDETDLLLVISKHNLYWFGIPNDFRLPIYKRCLYHYSELDEAGFFSQYANNSLYLAIRKCCNNEEQETLSRSIFINLTKNATWLNSRFDDNKDNKNSYTVTEGKFYQDFPNLYYHLKDKLKLNVIMDFIKPVIRNFMTNALNKHKLDGIGLELLDILIVTTYYGPNKINAFLMDTFILNLLKQCHYKFFVSNISELVIQISKIDCDLVILLEDLRSRIDLD